MDFKDRKIDFNEADRRYVELVRQRDAGEINDREFDNGRKKLSVRDDDGRWWAKSAKSGEWNYYDSGEWKPGVPPGFERFSQPSVKDEPESEESGTTAAVVGSGGATNPGRSEASSREASSREVGSGGEGERFVVRRRRRWRGLMMAAVVFAGIALVGVALFGWLGQGAAYALVENEAGGLSVEAPSEWDAVVTQDLEGESGRDSWTAWIGNGDVGSSLTAVNGFDGWRTGADGHQGMYMFASEELASWEHEYLVEAGPNDYWETCEGGGIQDFNRGEYSGKVLRWSDCGGESGHVAVTLAASPENRECVVVMQIGGYFRTADDEEKIQRILDTFEVDCAGI